MKDFTPPQVPNPHVLAKLTECVEHFQAHGPGAVYAILVQLMGAYEIGKHNDLVKHVCSFPLLDDVSVSVSGLAAKKGQEEGPKKTFH